MRKFTVDSNGYLHFNKTPVDSDLITSSHGTDESSSSCSNFPIHKPEMWAVDKNTIYAARHAIIVGLEYAKNCLDAHDMNVGRTTARNRLWAESIEKDIRDMEKAKELIFHEQSCSM